MEAVAKHDFQSSADDELSFHKGAKLKIISTDDDKNWYRAELAGREGFIPSNYIELRPTPWFVGRVSRQEAESMLLDRNEQGTFVQKDGAFLVRNSEHGTLGDFSLSVKFGSQVQHFKILRDSGKYFLWQVKFDSVNDLVRYHRTSSVSRAQTIYLQDMTRPKVIANYDFKPENLQEELELKRGDIVFVLNKNDPNWWMGELTRDAQVFRGLFPRTYVSPYSD